MAAASYDARASTYDDKTSFHRHLAAEYVKYADPKPGESLLDLACGTGLVTFEFANILQSNGHKPTVIGVDISPGMLAVARRKLDAEANAGLDIAFVQHDITDLSTLPAQQLATAGPFDLITVCSALVLLPSPASALAHWTSLLKHPLSPTHPGGRLIVDVPHPSSMLALKILEIMAPAFEIPVLGLRAWIASEASLADLMQSAGLDVNVRVTGIFVISRRARRRGGASGGLRKARRCGSAL